MRTLFGLLLAVVCSAVACSSSGSPTAVSGATESPALASQAESASPAQECPNFEGGSCLGPLSAGTYKTTVFTPQLTYKVPAGWGNFEDTPGNFLLIAPGYNLAGVDPGTSDYIGVYTRVVACDGSLPVGGLPDDIAGWITNRRGLDATTPRQVSVGGLDGVVLDVKLAKGSDGDCLISGLAPSSLEHGLIPGLSIRLYLLRRSGTLAVEVDDVRDGGNNLDAYSSVVEEMRFGV